MVRTLTFLLVLICFSGKAQQKVLLKGYIVDKQSMIPLPEASVKILQEGSQASTLKTDGLGYFETEILAKSTNLTITYVGYLDGQLMIPVERMATSVVDAGKIKLSPVAAELNSVSIIGTRNHFRFKDDVLVYSLKDDTANNKKSLSLAMQVLPFITVDINGNVSYKSNKKIVVLINGKVDNAISQNLTQTLKAIPASTIDRIEMMDPASYRYQMMGYDLAIDVITKDNIIGTHASLDVSQNSRNGFDRTLFGYLNKRALGGSFNLQQSRTKVNERKMAFFTEGTGQTTEQNFEVDYENNSYKADVGVNLQGKAGTFSLNTGVNFTRNSSLQFENFESSYKEAIDAWATEINWQNAKRTKNQWLIGSKFIHNSSEEDNMGIVNQYSNGNGEELLLQSDYTRIFSGKLPSKLDLGVKYIHRNNSSKLNARTLLDYDQDITISYAALNWKFKQNYSLTSALRFETTMIDAIYLTGGTPFQNSNIAILPQLNLSKSLSKSRNLGLQLRSRTTRPGIIYLNPYPNVLNSEYIVRGNPELLPQNTYTLALNYSKYGAKISYTLEYYKSLVNRSISEFTYLNPITQKQELTYINNGNNKFDGVYLYLSGKLLPKLRFNSTSSVGYVNVRRGDISNSGMFFYIYISSEYKLAKGYTLQALASFSNNTVLLQGEQTGTRLFTLAAAKEIFGDRGTINFSISDPFLNRRTFSTILDRNGINRLTENHRQARLFNFSFYYKFGKLGEEKIVSSKKIRNDDLKQKEDL